jgi:MFS family permease
VPRDSAATRPGPARTRAAGTTRPARVFYGWYVVAACAVIAAYSWGLGFYGLGVYLAVFHDRYGWSTSFISLTTAGFYLAGAAVALVIGGIIDQRGSRGILVYGAIVMGLSVITLGFITARWQLVTVYLVMATGYVCLGATAISGTVMPWFDRLQGRAMSVALTGPSAGGIVLVPLLVLLTDRWGFRTAVTVAGLLLMSSVLVLTTAVIKRRPQDLGLLPDGALAPSLDESAARVEPVRTPPEDRRWRRGSALRSPMFWTLTLPFCLALLAQVGFLVHQLPILEPELGRPRAALLVSTTTLAALLGRVIMGLLVDRLDRRVFSAGCFAVQGAMLLLMASVPSPVSLAMGSIGFGLGVGIVITLPPLLVRDEFGSESFGLIFAMVFAGMQVAVAAGPALVGVLRDAGNSYQIALWLLVVLEAVAVTLVLLGRRARHTRPMPASP